MKKQLAVILILLISLFLGACSNEDRNIASEGKSVVNIYYVNTKTSGIVSESYELIGNEQEDQIEELLYMLKKSPENAVYKSALSDNVTVKEFDFNEDGSLTINFESTYQEFSGIPEVLCRAAIVKTLSQITGVDYIQFDVNGKALKDSNDDLVGLQTKDDFIDSTGTEKNTKVKLYFANEEGTALIEYVTDVTYNGTGSLEELVIKQLIEGPTEIDMYPTIPKGTVLLNVTTKEGICYVNLNESFLEKLPGITDDIAIYSIVNSLVELPNNNVNKVQFLINNEVQKTFRENTTFDVLFERNLTLIEESK